MHCSLLILSFAALGLPLNDDCLPLSKLPGISCVPLFPSGIFWGMLIWDEWPETSAWIGMVLILIGGLYMVYREKARDVDVTLSSPMPASAASSQNFDYEEQDTDDANK